MTSNPLRDPRDRRIPEGRRALRAGALRRDRRPGQQEAAAGHLRPGQPRPAAARVLAGRLRPAGLGGRGLRAGSPTTRSRRTRARRSGTRSGSRWPRACGSCPASSPTTRRSTGSPQTSPNSTPSAGPAATTRSTCPCRRRPSPQVVAQLKRSGLSTPPEGPDGQRPWRRVVIEKPFGHDLASARELNAIAGTRCSPRTRSSASTTTWARRRSRTSWRCGSPTRCSSRSGTAATWTTSRSRWRRTSASAAGPGTTTGSARPGT